MGSKMSLSKFQIADKIPSKHRAMGDIYGKTFDTFKNLPQYRENNCSEILQSTVFKSPLFFTKNGFVNTVVECYNGHHNLIIRPDDIWAAIMTQFSFYINKHAEEFRKKFVDFKGNRELSVAIPGQLRNAPYDLFVKWMNKEIDNNLVDPDFKKWVLPNFSTTTDSDLVSIGIIFMASMKKYFEYKCCVMCGIPFITIKGTIEDWKDIYERLTKLKEYKLDEWYEMLEPVLKQFLLAKKGEVCLSFWRKICHYQDLGSGDPFISGWITVFCVFDEHGNWRGNKFNSRTVLDEETGVSYKWIDRVNIPDIPTGIVEVDLKIVDNGTAYKSILFAGHMAVELLDNGRTLKPSLGWVIALK